MNLECKMKPNLKKDKNKISIYKTATDNMIFTVLEQLKM